MKRLWLLRHAKSSWDDLSLRIRTGPWRPGAGGPPTGLRERFPTGALATLELDVERWRDLDHGMAIATTLVTPRSLESSAGA